MRWPIARDVLTAQEFRARMFLGLAAFGLVALAMALWAVTLLLSSDRRLLPLALPLLVPLLWAVGVYGARPIVLAQRYLGRDRMSQPLAELVRRAEELAPRLGLRRAVRVRAAALGTAPAIVFGYTRATSTIALAESLPQILTASATTEATQADLLRDFVLLHELAHLRHGDPLFVDWARSMLKLVPWWLVLSAAVSIPYLFGGQGMMLATGGVALWWCLLLAAALLRLILPSTLRHAESLADARAALALTPSEVARLVGSDERPDNTLARLLRRLAYACEHGPGVGVAAPWLERWGRRVAMRTRYCLLGPCAKAIYEYVFTTHPPLECRVQALRLDLQVAGARTELDGETTIYLGASVGLVLMLLAQMGAVVETLSGAGCGQTAFTMLLACLGAGAMFVGRLFALPARRSGTAGERNSRLTLARLCTACLSSVAIALIVAVPSGLSVQDASALTVWGFLFYVLTGWMMFMGPHAVVGGDQAPEMPRSRARAERLENALMLAPLAGGGLALLLAIVFVGPPGGAIGLGSAATAGAAGIAGGLSLGLFAAVLALRPSGSGRTHIALVVGGRQLALPGAYPGVVVAPTLAAGSVTVAALLMSALLPATERALEAIARISCPVNAFNHGLIAGAGAMFLLSAAGVVVRLRWDGLAGRWQRLGTCLWLLQLQGVGVRWKGPPDWLQIVSALRSSDGGFRRGPTAEAGCLETTLHATEAALRIETELQLDGLAEFLLAREARGGGFGPWPGALPSPMFSFWALSALGRAGHPVLLLRSAHGPYLESMVAVHLRRRTDLSLINVYWSLRGLKVLGLPTERWRAAVTELVATSLDRDPDDPLTMTTCLEVLDLVQDDTSALRERILREHFLPMIAWLRGLRVKTHLNTVAYLVASARLLGGEAWEEVRGLLTRIEDAVWAETETQLHTLEHAALSPHRRNLPRHAA